MQRLRLLPLWAIAAVLLSTAAARADEFRYSGQKAKAISLPGLLGGLASPATGEFYTAPGFTDPFGDVFGDGTGDATDVFSIAMVADTGASGIVLSDATQEALMLPLTGEVYSDVGIGGTELFDVTSPLRMMLAPSRIGAAGSETMSYYSSAGDYKMQARQMDPDVLGLFTIDINIVGTPVLNQHVMHVQPNVSIDDLFTIVPTIDYLDTELLSSLPATLPPGRAIHIPIDYVDFVDNPDAPVSTANNPVVRGVTIVDSRQSAATDPTQTMDWLWDTGGSLSVVGRNLARDVIGIDLDNETPVTTSEISGVGGDTRTLYGYRVDELILPTSTGDQFILEDYVIYVPEDGALPADLPGILGNTAWGVTFDDDLLLDFVESPFSDLYIDPFGKQVILIDPSAPSLVPEPGAFLLAACGAVLLFVGRRPLVPRR